MAVIFFCMLNYVQYQAIAAESLLSTLEKSKFSVEVSQGHALACCHSSGIVFRSRVPDSSITSTLVCFHNVIAIDQTLFHNELASVQV